MAPSDMKANSTVHEKSEKRREERKACFIPVDYAVQDRIYKDFIQNINSNGVFVESFSGMNIGDIGTKILMAFEWMNGNLPIKSKGTIVHKTKLGFGVKFDTPISLVAQA